MNDFEAKQEARRERLEQRAANATQASQAAYDASRRATAGIEMGQPILVGHHSERRHRAALARSDSAMRKSCQEHDKAQHYARQAAAVGTGGVSSDDPDALPKLRAQLADIEAVQERMKAANKVIRSAKATSDKVGALVSLGYSEAQAAQLTQPGCEGFPSYRLTNNRANGKRIQARIAELEQRRRREAVEVEGAGYRYREDPEENRVMFLFDGKPDSDTRAKLKAEGFKWSPGREGQPWVRQLTGNGIWAGRVVREWLSTRAKEAAQ